MFQRMQQSLIKLSTHCSAKNYQLLSHLVGLIFLLFLSYDVVVELFFVLFLFL